MGLFHFLIVVQGIVAASLVAIILMQRSEGGGLGMGGSPSGLISARGAADFMTRTTTILATTFILLSITLAFVAARQGGTRALETGFERNVPATGQAAPAAEAQPAPQEDKDKVGSEALDAASDAAAGKN
ncbi:preprotein translocase subunit SecG [Sphingorhabdus lutea]|uniref:Protein-export membrane protein SecG n=1 Tax=Sphingorhabdus lutea TaxID=1913578 RepID=A0A1L3JBW2_9SPHN|nr:preprotein translocase subunit SecG [Sphingorhabdus lutea]APG62618.1 preprotein translocase subunit SecG [Sphingorhabdus lutea]